MSSFIRNLENHWWWLADFNSQTICSAIVVPPKIESSWSYLKLLACFFRDHLSFSSYSQMSNFIQNHRIWAVTGIAHVGRAKSLGDTPQSNPAVFHISLDQQNRSESNRKPRSVVKCQSLFHTEFSLTKNHSFDFQIQFSPNPNCNFSRNSWRSSFDPSSDMCAMWHTTITSRFRSRLQCQALMRIRSSISMIRFSYLVPLKRGEND